MKTLSTILLVFLSMFAFANEKISKENNVVLEEREINDFEFFSCNQSFTGRVDASDGFWKAFDLTVGSEKSAVIKLGWSNSADLHLFLYNPEGDLAGIANGTDNPEVINAEDLTPGVWRLGVRARHGAASFTLNYDCQTTDPGNEVLVFEERINASGRDWITHEFQIENAQSAEATLNWSGSADLNLFFINPSGQTVAASNGNDNPEKVTISNPVKGTWRVAVKAQQGVADYKIVLTIKKSGSNPTTPDYAAKPEPGNVWWGAAINGNDTGDRLEEHEEEAGRPISIHRMFFQWEDRTNALIKHVKNDHKAGRLPWFSIKTPSWRAMGNGNYNGQIDEMIKALKETGKPVWLTIHHEPENGNGPNENEPPSAHVAMNRKVRERIDRLDADNIALAPIFISYSWIAGRDMDKWYAPGIYDFIGIDHYSKISSSLVNDNWIRIRRWVADKGLDVAVGEWGICDENNNKGNLVRQWYDHSVNSYKDGKGARVVALCAFDSNLNSTCDWRLKSSQFNAYIEKMKAPTTPDIRDFYKESSTNLLNTAIDPVESLSLYPNPASNTLRVDILDNDAYVIHFYDQTGTLVKTVEGISGSQSISIAELKSGLFMVEISNTSNGETARKKLFVE